MKIAAVRADLQVKAGAAGAFINMMEQLQERGHSVDIFTLSCSDELKAEMEERFNLHVAGFKKGRKPRLLRGFSLLVERARSLPYLLSLARIIRDGDYQVVFVDHYHLSTMILPFIKSVKTVYYCYEPPRFYYDQALMKQDLLGRIKYYINLPLYLLDKFLDRRLARQADLILADSDFTGECVWKAYGVFGKTVRLGVDSDLHRPVPGVEKEDFVLTVGVVQVQKGHDFVVRSLARIPPEIRPRLVIVYYMKDERLYRRLEREARSLGVEVEFKSFVDDDEFARLHSAARFVVLGFVMEPSLEPVAFAYRLPVVAVREAGVREVVGQETGLLTDRDETAFAAAVERLLKDPAEAEMMGERAREWVESEFTWAACGERLEACLEELLGRKQPVE